MNRLRADRTLQCRTAFPIPFFLKISFLFILLLAVLPVGRMPAAGPEIIINCNVHEGGCSQILAGLEITLDIRPKPVKAMQDLVFMVSLAGEKPAQPPYIDLGMPGMNMGPNRVRLKQISPTDYEGKGVIVRCPSGRRTWQATVTVPGKGKADFIFDVVY